MKLHYEPKTETERRYVEQMGIEAFQRQARLRDEELECKCGEFKRPGRLHKPGCPARRFRS